jgi:hypothetical protein
VVKLNYSDLNSIFNMSITFMVNYFLVRDDVFVDSETLLMTDFINLKIKAAQSFEYTHKNRICVCVFIEIIN